MLQLASSLLPIVMLHHVSDEPSHASLKPYSISRKSFLQLLEFVERENYQAETFNNLLKAESVNEIKKRQIVLTFDDCGKHLFDYVIPELQKRNIKAVFFMPTAHIGGVNSWDVAEGRAAIELMNDVDLSDLSRQGMEIGAHSHHHIPLKGETEQSVRYEVGESKRILESIIDRKVVSFAYPFGSVPRHYKQLLETAGYSYACSIYTPNQNNLSLRRFIYHDGDTNETLKQKVSLLYKWFRYFSDKLK